MIPDTMQQAVIVGPERVEVRQAPRPRLRAADEILVRTSSAGICSGDLMPWYLAKKVGTVLGHEVVGRAVEVGRVVTGISPGDLVFMHHHAPCGQCSECQRALFVHCPTWKRSHLDPGGMAEWIRVPGENVRGDTFRVNDLHPEQAVFIEPLACCVKAFSRAGNVAGARVVVIGCGIMGLLNILLARALGAAQVIAVEPDEFRRVLAARCGAEVLNPVAAENSLAQQGDLVVIGPGFPAVIRQAVEYVRPGGVALLFTPTASGEQTVLDLGELYFREVSLVPSYSCGPPDTRRAYDLLREGRIDPRPLITHRFPLAQAGTAFATARAGGEAVKVLVTFEEMKG